MSIQYLCIDSLCIIQDSEEDWKRESVSMMAVYSGSYCNVAATGAADTGAADTGAADTGAADTRTGLLLRGRNDLLCV
jgi:hypothetical protein